MTDRARKTIATLVGLPAAAVAIAFGSDLPLLWRALGGILIGGMAVGVASLVLVPLDLLLQRRRG